MTKLTVTEIGSVLLSKVMGRKVILAMNALRMGGSQTYAITLAGVLRQNGYEPIIVAKHGSLSRRASQVADIRHVVWPEGSSCDYRSGPKAGVAQALGYASLRHLARRLEETPPIAVIASQPWPLELFWRYRSWLFPRAARIALIHGQTQVELPSPDYVNLRLFDHVFTTTSESVEAVRATFDRSAVLLGNLFSAASYWDGFSPSGALPAADVTFLGTLTPNKIAPLDALFELAALEPDLRVVVVGGGPEYPRLRASVATLGLNDRVIFVGSTSDPREFIANTAVVLTAGRGAIEAASYGRSVLVGTSDGFAGLLRPATLAQFQRYNFTGRLPTSVSPTPTALASALADARNQSGAERQEIARRLSQVGSVEPLLDALNAP